MLSTLCLLLCAVPAAGDACNYGPTHHSHIVLPLASTAAACKAADARFVMSHGATFFCPHHFDIKLLATIDEAAARATLCDTHFDALASGVSSKMVLRPTLPAGGLPALAHGEMDSWKSHVMYRKSDVPGVQRASAIAACLTSASLSLSLSLWLFRTYYSRRPQLRQGQQCWP